MRSQTGRPFKISTKTRMRFPRTKEHKRAGSLLRPPNRPPKFQSWVLQPLSVFVGRFRRLRRELYTKPARAEYVLARIASKDTDLAEELGIG
ncbi:hypothetical protein LCGC14_1329340 [marine sediment metagenome]|uniref:Uncharacterized protein n=1 Tax=marine sediment metagenome TaxID=412755 RepID=A0A0F9KH39_9ZZZZ